MFWLSLGAIIAAGILLIALSIVIGNKTINNRDYEPYAVVSILVSMIVGIIKVVSGATLAQSFIVAGIILGCMIVVSVIAYRILS